MLFLALGLMMSGCTKEEECDDCLETFRCKINGEKWEPSCSDAAPVRWCPDIDCLYYEESRGIEIRVVNRRENNRLHFANRGLIMNKPVNIDLLDREYIDYTRGNCGGYDLIQELPNYIEMTALDTINFTVEGTFAFSVLGTCDGDTLHITDGYFHLAYR
jgi:hypothetical protein